MREIPILVVTLYGGLWANVIASRRFFLTNYSFPDRKGNKERKMMDEYTIGYNKAIDKVSLVRPQHYSCSDIQEFQGNTTFAVSVAPFLSNWDLGKMGLSFFSVSFVSFDFSHWSSEIGLLSSLGQSKYLFCKLLMEWYVQT